MSSNKDLFPQVSVDVEWEHDFLPSMSVRSQCLPYFPLMGQCHGRQVKTEDLSKIEGCIAWYVKYHSFYQKSPFITRIWKISTSRRKTINRCSYQDNRGYILPERILRQPSYKCFNVLHEHPWKKWKKNRKSLTKK